MQVLEFRAVCRGLVERQVDGLLVGEWQVEAVAVFDEVTLIQFLLAVGGHLALARSAQAIAFFGLRQNHGRLTGVRRSGGVSRVNLDEVMASAFQPINLLVGHALRQAL